MDPSVATSALLGSLLAVAVAADVAQRRIPNTVVLVIAVAGFAAQWVGSGPAAAITGALTGAGVLGALLLPWASGKLGGGDVKLVAATAVWLGPSRVLAFLALTAVAGAPVAVVTRLAHLRANRLLPGRAADGPAAEALVLPRETVPYAAAIALGAFAALQGVLP